MPRRELPYVGGLSRDPTLHQSAQDTINYLPVPAPRPGARSAVILRQAPGLRPWVDAHVSGIAGVGPTRKLHNVEGRLLWVTGNALVEVTPAGVMVPRGTIPGVERVSMAHNQQGLGHEVLTVNGQAGYVLDTGTLAFGRVTDEAFTGALQVAYADQYLVGVESQGRHWMHSDLSDAYSWNSFDRYEAEADPDRIVGIAVNHREVLVFGKETIEPFVNNPTDPAGIAPYVRADNTVIEAGCAARHSIVSMDNTLWWLDNHHIIRRLEGYTAARMSHDGVEAMLAACSPSEIARAYAYPWEDRGHKVYYLTVPGRFTIGFDLLSGEFHRRLSPDRDVWRLSDIVYWNGQWIGGDAYTGRLYVLDWDYFYDGRDELIRERVSGVLADHQNAVTVNSVELVLGVGGAECALGDFIAQPEGPTISGPETYLYVVGDAFDLTWTATGGTAPYTFTIAPGSTAPPDGVLAGAGGMTGTTTVAASSTFTVRVTDANGLWDEIEVAGEVIAADLVCSAESSYDGGAAMPAEIEVGLGAGTGNVVLNFCTGGVPDKFEVWFDGVKVIDTGYVGDTSRQTELDAEIEPNETITQRTGTSVSGGGITSAQLDWESEQYDTATFYKSTATTTATVKVYAPMDATAWYFALLCPDGEPPDE